MQVTREQLWKDVFEILPWTWEVVEANSLGFPLPKALDMAAIQLFMDAEADTDRAKHIRWALNELRCGRWLDK